MKTTIGVSALCAAILFPESAAASALDDYREACTAPYYAYLAASAPTFDVDEEIKVSDAAHAVAGNACAAFVAHLSTLTSPTAEQRFALFKALRWLGQDDSPDGESECIQVREFAVELPRSPEVLYHLGLCADGEEETIALWREAVALDPEHFNALSALTEYIEYSGSHFGIDAQTLARYHESLYQVAPDRTYKFRAAGCILRLADAAEDTRAASVIRERVRRDLVLDALGPVPSDRLSSLRWTCDRSLFAFDLEDECLTAVEELTEFAARQGNPIPSRLLRLVPPIVGSLARLRDDSTGPWDTASKAVAIMRLKAALDAHPVPLRSSEHHRAYAEAFLDGEARIRSLRRALDLDHANLGAHDAKKVDDPAEMP